MNGTSRPFAVVQCPFWSLRWCAERRFTGYVAGVLWATGARLWCGHRASRGQLPERAEDQPDRRSGRPTLPPFALLQAAWRHIRLHPGRRVPHQLAPGASVRGACGSAWTRTAASTWWKTSTRRTSGARHTTAALGRWRAPSLNLPNIKRRRSRHTGRATAAGPKPETAAL
eukprot:5420546-Prymnesium_polylepis.1